MSVSGRSAYSFATPPQWEGCLMSGVQRAAAGDGMTLRPYGGYTPQASRSFASPGAAAPAIAAAGEGLWRDHDGSLHRAEGDMEARQRAPGSISRTNRCVATREGLWVVDRAQRRVECFDQATLVRRFAVELPDRDIVDIDGGRRGGVLVLVQGDDGAEVLAIDRAGNPGNALALGPIDPPCGFCYLRSPDRIFVLADEGRRVTGFAMRDGRRVRTVACAMLAPCFTASTIASDGDMCLFIGGVAQVKDGARIVDDPLIVALDADGSPVGELQLAEEATGIAALGGTLVATGGRGLYHFTRADSVPDAGPAVEGVLATPMLDAPVTAEARGWLRIEATARLPAGATLEIAFFASDDAEERREIAKVADDKSVAQGQRIGMIRAAAATQRTPVVFHGTDDTATQPGVFSVPLFDVESDQIRVCLSLAAAPGSALPTLLSLAILYPARTLMDALPAIYRRTDTQPGDFLARLVGVMQATSDDLDRRIGELARNLDPAHAPDAWMNFVARWLGIPWDDAMERAQKQCLLGHAEALGRARGTRAGLDLLLACLVPGAPRRFRIVDATVDHGLARVGGPGCEGSTLPAILTGLPDSAPLPGVQAKLDAMRLPCEGKYDSDTTSRFLGALRIDVAASAEERDRWSRWLGRVVGAMLPAGVRPSVRWLGVTALRGDRLGDDLVLDEPPYGRLGTDALLGASRLTPGPSTLPAAFDGGGPTLH